MLPRLSANTLIRLARQCKISDKNTGAMIPFEPSDEQIEAARLSEQAQRKGKWLFLAKPRQVYMSTWFCFEDAVFAMLCDATNNPVSVGIAIDTDAKASKRNDAVESFLKQLGCRYKRKRASAGNPDTIRLPNGSTVESFSAGGNRAGSSVSFHRLHLTETPYWKLGSEAYSSLMPALSGQGFCVNETTMDVTPDGFIEELWAGNNRYIKHMFSVERHERYRADPFSISDKRWAELQKEGYTNRAAAAWFDDAINSVCAGNLTQAFRLFPQMEHHLFMVGEGRFIKAIPKVVAPKSYITVTGEGGEQYAVDIYMDKNEVRYPLVIGVDTGAAKDRDKSAVLMLDSDRRVVACFADENIYADDVAKVAKELQRIYTNTHIVEWPNQGPPAKVPQAIIEDNGVGTATLQAARRISLRCRAVHTGEASRMQGLLLVKREIESGRLFGPKGLLEECNSIAFDEKKKKFTGRKDLLMAASFCLLALERKLPQPEEKKGFDLTGKLKAKRK